MFLLNTHGVAMLAFFDSAILHAHEGEHGGFFSEVVLHGLKEVATVLPFLFITYLLMEYIEHRAKSRSEDFMRRAGLFAPAVGGLLGVLPQCGFSAAASGLYSGGVITAGTLIAVFLSTSDEMLPILISGQISPLGILAILGYKVAVAIALGLLIDFYLRRRGINHVCHHESHDECVDECHCHHESDCGGGIVKSALLHTAKTFGFVLLVTIIINTAIFFLGEEGLHSIIPRIPVLGHFVAAVFGLIPNCAASVALSTLATEGVISVGVMLSGLFSGAGVGLAVLLRQNKPKKENATIIAILILAGTVFGFLADLIMPGVLGL